MASSKKVSDKDLASARDLLAPLDEQAEQRPIEWLDYARTWNSLFKIEIEKNTANKEELLEFYVHLEEQSEKLQYFILQNQNLYEIYDKKYRAIKPVIEKFAETDDKHLYAMQSQLKLIQTIRDLLATSFENLSEYANHQAGFKIISMKQANSLYNYLNIITSQHRNDKAVVAHNQKVAAQVIALVKKESILYTNVDEIFSKVSSGKTKISNIEHSLECKCERLQKTTRDKIFKITQHYLDYLEKETIELLTVLQAQKVPFMRNCLASNEDTFVTQLSSGERINMSKIYESPELGRWLKPDELNLIFKFAQLKQFSLSINNATQFDDLINLSSNILKNPEIKQRFSKQRKFVGKLFDKVKSSKGKTFLNDLNKLVSKCVILEPDQPIKQLRKKK